MAWAAQAFRQAERIAEDHARDVSSWDTWASEAKTMPKGDEWTDASPYGLDEDDDRTCAQILAGVPAHAQEHRHDSDGPVALLNQGVHRLRQVGRHQLQKSTTDLHAGCLLSHFMGDGVDGGTPERVPRAMGKEHDGCDRFVHRLSTIQPKAANEITM